MCRASHEFLPLGKIEAEDFIQELLGCIDALRPAARVISPAMHTIADYHQLLREARYALASTYDRDWYKNTRRKLYADGVEQMIARLDAALKEG